MSNLSRSTELLNCLVALSTKTPDFPHPLWDQGFQLENIEPHFLLSDGAQVNPDIQFKRNEDQLVFFECKDGHVDSDQLARYKRMTIDDVKRAKITALSSARLSFDLAYFGTKEKEEKLITSIEKDGNGFPIIILDSNAKRISKNISSQKFRNESLNAAFDEIQFETPVPTSFIPFTADDDDETITTVLLQHFMSKSEYEFTLDELLEDLFSYLIHNYSREGKDELKGRLGKLINKLKAIPELLSSISFQNNKYKIKPSGPISFRNQCLKIIKQYEEQKGRVTLTKWL